jgi:hemerythrin-like domain-containing protein
MTASADTTRVLREEHEWILEVAGALQRILEAEAATGALDLDAAEKSVRFIRLFADACHHGKEEELLFPALEEVGMPRHAGPIAVMLEDHRRGREYAGQMARALADAREGDEVAVRSFVNAAYGYIQLIRSHILKENNVLFNMADEMVGAEACQRLCVAYDGVCAGRFEGCTKAELQALAKELTEAYPMES